MFFQLPKERTYINLMPFQFGMCNMQEQASYKYILLYKFINDTEQQEKNIHDRNEGPQQSGASNAVNHGCCTLPIIPVKVTLDSCVVECNVFLEPGRNISFIECLAAQLQCTRTKTLLNVETMGNQVRQQTTIRSGFTIAAIMPGAHLSYQFS